MIKRDGGYETYEESALTEDMLRRIILELSQKYFARISFTEHKVKLRFITRLYAEFVCTWNLDKYFFTTELQKFFHNQNSVRVTEKEN